MLLQDSFFVDAATQTAVSDNVWMHKKMRQCDNCNCFTGPAWQKSVDKKRKVMDSLPKHPTVVNIPKNKIHIVNIKSPTFASVFKEFVLEETMMYGIDVENSITPWQKDTGNIPVLIQIARSFEAIDDPRNDDILLIIIPLFTGKDIFTGSAKQLKDFLESSRRYQKYGFGVGSDLFTMQKHMGITVSMHDLQHDFSPQLGLTTVVAKYGVDVISPVIGPDSYPTFSKWQNRLCECQILYAALDAWCVLLLAKLYRRIPMSDRTFV